MFGPMAFVWIVLGCIFAGAVHDFFSGMLSVRMKGATVGEIVGNNLGEFARQVMRIFSIILLVLVGVVFLTSPAQILTTLVCGKMNANVYLSLIHISEPTRQAEISYAVFCLKKKKKKKKK